MLSSYQRPVTRSQLNRENKRRARSESPFRSERPSKVLRSGPAETSPKVPPRTAQVEDPKDISLPPSPPLLPELSDSDIRHLFTKFRTDPRTAFWALTSRANPPKEWGYTPAIKTTANSSVQSVDSMIYESALRMNGVLVREDFDTPPAWVLDEMRKVFKTYPLNDSFTEGGNSGLKGDQSNAQHYDEEFISFKYSCRHYTGKNDATLRDFFGRHLGLRPTIDESMEYTRKNKNKCRDYITRETFLHSLKFLFKNQEDIVTPKISLTIGYTQTIIAPESWMILLDPASTAAKAKFSINPNNNLYFPFLLVQMKAHAGKLRKAERQCRTAAAFCFRLFEQLHDEPGQIMFTMTLCYQMAELFVVWTERAPDPDDPPIVYQYSMAQYLFKYEQSYTNTRCWVKDVLEWGYGERQDFIKEELKKFREAYVEDPTVADLPGTTATGSSDVSGLGYTASESE